MRTILLGALLIFYSSAFAQLGGPCDIMAPRDTTDWGIGVIRWYDKYFKALDRQDEAFVIGQVSIYKVGSAGIPISHADVAYAGYIDYRFLKVFEIKNTLHKVLVNTIEGGLWVDFDQLNSNGVTFNTYYSILFNDNPN